MEESMDVNVAPLHSPPPPQFPAKEQQQDSLASLDSLDKRGPYQQSPPVPPPPPPPPPIQQPHQRPEAAEPLLPQAHPHPPQKQPSHSTIGSLSSGPLDGLLPAKASDPPTTSEPGPPAEYINKPSGRAGLNTSASLNRAPAQRSSPISPFIEPRVVENLAAAVVLAAATPPSSTLITTTTTTTAAAATAPAASSSSSSSSSSRAAIGPTTAPAQASADALSNIDPSLRDDERVPATIPPLSNGEGPPSPPHSSMSAPQPPHGPPRQQQVSYQNPTPYPGTGIPGAPYAYPTSTHPSAEAYRASAAAAVGNMALPSMRTLDHMQHPQAHTMHMAPQPMPGHPHPAMAMGYYTMPPHYGIPADPNAMRYALPPNLADPRVALSGGRHKKEIKRRTKTGCLTCRKRRIKCDETHPTCNNCKKSKRECMGYDPIFKQTAQSSTPLQPAGNSQQSPPTTALPSAPTVPSNQASTPTSNYQPSAQSNLSYDTSSASPPIKHNGFDFAAAIDPSLEAQYRLKSESSVSAIAQSVGGGLHRRAQPMKVDELLALGGLAPPATAAVSGSETSSSAPLMPSQAVVDEITRLYFDVYVKGLNDFFETQWYYLSYDPAARNPRSVLLGNSTVLSLFATFLDAISRMATTDPSDMTHTGNLEAGVVWALACLPLSVSSDLTSSHGPTSQAPPDDTLMITRRIHLFETLISGALLDYNPLSSLSAEERSGTRGKELEFWFHLGKYLCSTTSPEDRQFCVHQMRNLLDGRENRDVLYSLAIIREFAPHFPATYETEAPIHLDESDMRSRLVVATRFIRDESTHTGGTTNVVRRFADLALRSLVWPGYNINRQAVS